MRAVVGSRKHDGEGLLANGESSVLDGLPVSSLPGSPGEQPFV
jgi:hypothetical protein